MRRRDPRPLLPAFRSFSARVPVGRAIVAKVTERGGPVAREDGAGSSGRARLAGGREAFVPYGTIGFIPERGGPIRVNMRRKQAAIGSAADRLPISYEPNDPGMMKLKM